MASPKLSASVLVGQALAELDALPADVRREVAQRVVEMSATGIGASQGCAHVVAVHDTARAIDHVATEVIHRAGSAEPLSASARLEAAAGTPFDPGHLPASARFLRALLLPTPEQLAVDVRQAVLPLLAGAALTYLASQRAAPSTPNACGGDVRRPVPARVEAEPTPAPPLPPLVRPEDATPEDTTDDGVGTCTDDAARKR